MQTQVQESPEREPGCLISKIHFDVLEIDPKAKYGHYIAVEGNHNYDFNFKDSNEAEQFYIAIVNDSNNAGTFNMKAATDIANELRRQY